MMVKLNGCIFWSKMITYWKNIILFGIKSALILKKKLTVNLSIIKILKTKIKFYINEVTDFYDKEIPKVDSNHTYLAVINLESALTKKWKLLKIIKKKTIKKRWLLNILLRI